MRFAHMADCHIGAWREPKLREANMQAFSKAMDICIEKEVDFILIAGDLFNTSFPGIEGLKETVLKLREIKEKGIAVYVVPGSHDFSPSGKTMLDVLENANLFVNVFRGEIEDDRLKLSFAVDKKTGAKITGIIGRRGLLEKSYYENLDKSALESEQGFKIFMFHSQIEELKQGDMDFEAVPISFLPKDFDYYAGGHVHTVLNKNMKDYGTIVYPGPLFPNNFSELETLQNGGFFIVDVKDRKMDVEYQQIVVYNVFPILIDCTERSAEEVRAEILKAASDREFINTLVLIRLYGKLEVGKIHDINFSEIFTQLYNKGAFFVMKNTANLKSEEFEEVSVSADSVDKIEEAVINENASQMKIKGYDKEEAAALLKALMKALSSEKKEGERVSDFENRIKSEIQKLLDIVL